jgi:2-polyprenyl-6-methoxyphenol hydroxylase-like FAD-dependent oxidoreductase
MRISQVVLEPVLKDILERRAKHVGIRFGWALESFEQDAEGVTSVIRSPETGETQTVRSRYLVGCDGAGSVTRSQLGIGLDDMMAGSDPAAGRMYMIHFRSRDRAFFERFGTVWHVQAPHDGTVIAQNDLDTWTLHVPLPPDAAVDAIDPAAFLRERLGANVACEILVANAWKPRLVVAERYGDGRVWLAGDSAHQVVPTGGYGMNTGVGDAVDIGWKLEALLSGWGGPQLLPAYEIERRHVGLRNRAASARHVSIRGQIAGAWSPAIHEDSPRGEQARARLGEKIRTLGNLENEALGIEIGYRYDESPIVCHESTEPPPYEMERFEPTSWPGVRAPSLFLADGSALLDRLGRGFTLLRFAEVDVEPIARAATARGVPLEVVDLREAHARRIYERDLVLVRPDHHVAWRGDEPPLDALTP